MSSNRIGRINDEIQKELSDMRDEFNAKKAQWENEKNAIGKVQKLREELEEANAQLEKAQREYDLEKAAELLRSTRLKTGEIGMECGFADGSYFIKTFREIKHCTPKEYRAKFC